MRLKLLGAGVVLAALAGCEIPPEGTNAEDVANYQAAVASIGCVMVSESDYLPVELQAGLTREQTQALTSYHLGTGKAVKLEDGGVRLTVGDCATDAA